MGQRVWLCCRMNAGSGVIERSAEPAEPTDSELALRWAVNPIRSSGLPTAPVLFGRL